MVVKIQFLYLQTTIYGVFSVYLRHKSIEIVPKSYYFNIARIFTIQYTLFLWQSYLVLCSNWSHLVGIPILQRNYLRADHPRRIRNGQDFPVHWSQSNSVGGRWWKSKPYSEIIRAYNKFIAENVPEPKRPLKVFLCHIMPVGYAHADRDPVRGLPAGTRLTQDGGDAWIQCKIKWNLIQRFIIAIPSAWKDMIIPNRDYIL